MTKPLREAYGEALLKYGGGNPDVVVLDADVSSSSRSCLFGAEYPERFFNVGIAESNMTGMAAGFASVGKTAVANTFAIFFSTLGLCAARGLISYTNLNVKLMGAYGGMSGAYDGPSHHAMEDIAIMRTLPNMTVMCASDNAIVDWMVKTALDTPGPFYIRLTRDAAADVHKPGADFQIGKGAVVREGKDATIIATGVMVGKALQAAEMLSSQGIRAGVVDMFTIKPLDTELILAKATETGLIITAEEHSVIGGLGGAVAEAIARSDANPVMEFVGLRDRYAETASHKELLERYGMDGKDIASAVLKGLSRKNNRHGGRAAICADTP